ncbi:mesoderm-specific transcript homolog protein-like [Saccoglossus kowalevskii]
MEKWQVLPLVGVILAIFLNYPAPKLSTEMKEWTKSGRYFTHKEYRIFYKGMATTFE